MALSQSFKRWRKKHFDIFHPHYEANGLAVRNRLLSFLDDQAFEQAWRAAHDGNIEGWRGRVPDIRWRAHVACWAAKHASEIEGDFVECGVHTGLLSMTVCHFLGFHRLPRTFWLCDTFEGIPVESLPAEERAAAQRQNRTTYFDCWEFAKRNFAPFPNARLVRGVLPESLAQAKIGRIAYLSVDLNSASAEKAVMETLWDRLAPSAMVVIDDYAFKGHESQHRMWNAFAASRERMILTLPTGQGLLIR